MDTFQAYRLHHPPQGGEPPNGRLDTLTIDDLSAGDTTIRVAYAGLNYKDALAAAGRGKIVRDYPRIPGIDFTGTVVQSANPALTPGMAVIVHGFGAGVSHDGGYAQMARVPGAWVMPLPQEISLLDGATLGAAGYTAALSLHWMEHNGLRPDQGPVLVTGATGGVATMAIDILHGCGYRVTAMTGKSDAHDWLTRLGAHACVAPPDASVIPALGKGAWAGAIDSVGGPLLAWVASAIQPEGVIATFGNAGGANVPTTVYPFILRGVKLLGINANSSMDVRQAVWRKLASTYRPRHLPAVRQLITLQEVPAILAKMLERQHVGRTVIDMNAKSSITPA